MVISAKPLKSSSLFPWACLTVSATSSEFMASNCLLFSFSVLFRRELATLTSNLWVRVPLAFDSYMTVLSSKSTVSVLSANVEVILGLSSFKKCCCLETSGEKCSSNVNILTSSPFTPKVGKGYEAYWSCSDPWVGSKNSKVENYCYLPCRLIGFSKWSAGLVFVFFFTCLFDITCLFFSYSFCHMKNCFARCSSSEAMYCSNVVPLLQRDCMLERSCFWELLGGIISLLKLVLSCLFFFFFVDCCCFLRWLLLALLPSSCKVSSCWLPVGFWRFSALRGAFFLLLC